MAAKTQKKSGGADMKRKRNPNHKSEGPVPTAKKQKLASNQKKPKFNPSNIKNKATKQKSNLTEKEYKNPNEKKGEVEDSKKLSRLRAKVRSFLNFFIFAMLCLLSLFVVNFSAVSMSERCEISCG